MGQVLNIRGKTEQRVALVVNCLQAAGKPLTYEDLRIATGGKRQKDGRILGGTSYDLLLYILATLVHVGFVRREDVPEGPGRPRVNFEWVGGTKGKAQALGA